MKQVGRGVRRLSVVGKQQDSAGASDTPAAQSGPSEPAPLTRREQGLLKAQEVKREKARITAEAKAAGERSRLEKFRAGEYPISEWEDEEINKGRPRNLDGSFGGGWPRFTGREQQQIKAELLKRGQNLVDSMYMDALKVLKDVAKNGDTSAARVKAADLLIQRTAGKVPERIEIKSSDPWQDILDDIMDDEVLSRMTTPDEETASGSH